MFTVSGGGRPKLLDRLTPEKIRQALQTTVRTRATAMASDLTKDFQRGVERAAESVARQAAEEKQPVPEATERLLEAGREIEFNEGPCSSSIIVAGAVGSEVSVSEKETPAGPAPLVARTFEYGSAALGVPTVPTFRTSIQREVNRAGQTIREARDSLL